MQVSYLACPECGKSEPHEHTVTHYWPPMCMHKWTVLGRFGDPDPDQFCEGGCGQTYMAVMNAVQSSGANNAD